MPTRAEIYPDEAEAQMRPAQNAAYQIDATRARLRALVEQLEAEMTDANEKNEHSLVAELLARHQKTERELEDAEQDFVSAMDHIGQVQEYWYEEQIGSD